MKSNPILEEHVVKHIQICYDLSWSAQRCSFSARPFGGLSSKAVYYEPSMGDMLANSFCMALWMCASNISELSNKCGTSHVRSVAGYGNR